MKAAFHCFILDDPGDFGLLNLQRIFIAGRLLSVQRFNNITTTYSLIKIPDFASKDFFPFTKAEAKEYLQWFLSIKNERIKILEEQVKELYPNWIADYIRDSLEKLYSWFKQRVIYRPMNEEEKKAVEGQISKTPLFVGVIPIPTQTFTDETVSMCFDVGCYFSRVFELQVNEGEWTCKVNSIKFIYYGQPLIVKKDVKVSMNPRTFMEGIVRRILGNDVKEIILIDLLDT